MGFIPSNFSRMWDKEVKALAQACVTEPRLVQIIGSNCEPTAEEKEYLDSLDCHDPYGMFYISDMIWRVEHALADGRDAIAKMAVANIYQVISGKDYCSHLFDGNSECAEYQRIYKLKVALGELLNH